MANDSPSMPPRTMRVIILSSSTTSSSLDLWDEEPDDDDDGVVDDDDDVSHPAGMTAPSSSTGTQSQSIVAL